MSLIPWPYRMAAVVALVVAVFTTGWVKGAQHEQQNTLRAQMVAQSRVMAVERKQNAITHQVAEQHEAAAERIRTVYRTVNREVIRYVQSPDHPVCRLDAGWVQYHDAAAVPAAADAARQPDDPAASATTDDALQTVVANYETCHLNAQRLSDLQSWVMAQMGAR